MVFPKRDYPPQSPTQNYPFPFDPRTNEPSFCRETGADAWTWHEIVMPKEYEGQPGTDAWLWRPHVALCPVSFTQFQLRHHDLNLNEQPIGTRLDNMGITALTLYHELFHVVYGDMTDRTAWFTKWQRDGTPHVGFVPPSSCLSERTLTCPGGPTPKLAGETARSGRGAV